jgi:hypothetical protein
MAERRSSSTAPCARHGRAQVLLHSALRLLQRVVHPQHLETVPVALLREDAHHPAATAIERERSVAPLHLQLLDFVLLLGGLRLSGLGGQRVLHDLWRYLLLINAGHGLILGRGMGIVRHVNRMAEDVATGKKQNKKIT